MTAVKTIEGSGTAPLQPSFYFSLLYLFIEYMRPQSMYESLSGFPLAQIAILGIIIAFVLEGKKIVNSSFQNTLLLLYLFWFLVSSIFAFNSDLAWQPLSDFSKIVIIYFC